MSTLRLLKTPARLPASDDALEQLERHLCEETTLQARAPRSPRVQPDPDAASEVERLRAAIAMRLERGHTLETVERELIVPSRLSEEQQSALWVYAWSHPKRPPRTAPRLSGWTVLGNSLLTLIGIHRH